MQIILKEFQGIQDDMPLALAIGENSQNSGGQHGIYRCSISLFWISLTSSPTRGIPMSRRRVEDMGENFFPCSLWLIKVDDPEVEDHEQQVCGVILVHVDDVLVLADRGMIEEVTNKIRSKWEIYRLDNGDYFASQNAFIRELVKRHDCAIDFSTLPCRNVPEPEEEFEKSPELTREAQQLAGELLWLTTKTRPDIAFATSRICTTTAKSPSWSIREAKHLIKYHNKMQGVGLTFKSGATNELEVATDSSFSPRGGLSHGSVVAMVGGTPILWKSSKQPFPCLSTAEGVILGDSLACLVEEVEGRVKKT